MNLNWQQLNKLLIIMLITVSTLSIPLLYGGVVNSYDIDFDIDDKAFLTLTYPIEARPGDTITFNVTIEPYDEKIVIQDINLCINGWNYTNYRTIFNATFLNDSVVDVGSTVFEVVNVTIPEDIRGYMEVWISGHIESYPPTGLSTYGNISGMMIIVRESLYSDISDLNIQLLNENSQLRLEISALNQSYRDYRLGHPFDLQDYYFLNNSFNALNNSYNAYMQTHTHSDSEYSADIAMIRDTNNLSIVILATLSVAFLGTSIYFINKSRHVK